MFQYTKQRQPSPNTQYGRWLSTPSKEEEIVISGMSGRFPESENIYEFRDNLYNKVDMVTETYPKWKDAHALMPARTSKVHNKDKLDAGYFGLHHRQTENMEPMMRKFLEVAVEAVLDAGVNPKELEGSKTGVFVGACWADMENRTVREISEPHQFKVTGYLRAFVPHRISYFLKLKGPSCIIDTACSSSLNALDLGFKAIRNGQCDNALVGGTNILMHPAVVLQFARLGVLSKDGCCKVFDQDADGYARGDTIACIFLQKRKNARRIYAQLIYSKVNCDGFKEQGITFPSSSMQQQLMSEICQDTGIHPSEFSYMEAHGTGTQVGDSEEVKAIDNAIAKHRQKPLLIGSVKSNIGHTEPSSGVCSIVKVLIAMETGKIPPNINFKKVKAGMEGIEKGRMQVVTESTLLEGDGAIVGVNNFGFGGNNAHCLTRRFDKKKVGEKVKNTPMLVCFSGRTEDAVKVIIDYLNQRPLDSEYIGLYHQLFKYDINNHTYRGYIIISKKESNRFSTKSVPGKVPPLLIKFGCLKNNFKIIGSYLMQFPIFQTMIERIDKFLYENKINLAGLFSEESHFNDEDLAAIAVQIAIADVLKTLKIEASMVLGDSIEGNLVASYYKEKFSLEEALFEAWKLVKNSANMITNSKLDDAIKKIDRKRENKSDQSGIVLNISDQINNKDWFFIENKKVKFLDIIGRLYQEGFNVQLHKLYPEVEYPVSRGTPMISPLIRWNHNRSWLTYEYEERTTANLNEQEFNISVKRQEYKYFGGHVIDGRNLFPAMGYLHLVWELFCENRSLLTIDTPICFENCKFIRAVTLPKEEFVQFAVSIQKGTGHFEITEKDSLVVSGRIYYLEDDSQHQENSAPSVLNNEDPSMVLEQDEIYKELHLRGYNYKDLFKGIVRCDVKATNGLLRWDDNWVTFMDNMLQMKILQNDTRLLYVPVGIKKVTINPIKHLELIESIKDKECLIPVQVCKENNIIKSGAIEIQGLSASSITRRKDLTEPVLEKYDFVPNKAELKLVDSIKVNIQILLENTLENDVKIVELIDEFSNLESKPLLETILRTLEDIPLVKPNLIISTKSKIQEVPGVKIEEFMFNKESKLHLMIGTKILQRSDLLKQVLNALHPKGFILSKEDDLILEVMEELEILTEHTTEEGKLILFRKSKSHEDCKYMEVTSDTLEWIPQLQSALKSQENIVVFSQNKQNDGILGLINCIRREPGGNRVRCFFVMDEQPKFDPEEPFYKNQIRKDLAFNIYKNSQWGTYRHLPLEENNEVESEHCFVNSTVKGDISSLKWIEGPLTSDETNQTLVYVYNSAINFKDIMLASGRINVDTITTDRIEQESVLGFEFSGKDLRGNRVMGMTSSRALATLVAADSHFLWSVRDEWSLEDAATIPVVYSTVIYALLMMTKLTPGTSILIHSATGGIGIAALNVALYHQCEIFVTVGTQEKRTFLRNNFPQIPESHIGNSRDTSFEEMIKSQTKGRGVDIVLNSLSDEKLKASVRCLAPGGQLMEIGKYDLANDTSLNLLLMTEGKSYHGIMLDRIFAEKPELKEILVRKMNEGIKFGYVKPLPKTVFNIEQVETAFRYMMTGKHTGKVMIQIRNEEESINHRVVFKGLSSFFCSSEKCYIIVGGLGGFGLELADWLVIRGAKNLILVSRSGIKTGYQRQRLEIFKSYNVNISVDTTDLTTKENCLEFIKKVNKIAPIHGIFNLAVVLQDALFENQTEESFATSLAPKANTTKHLDEITRQFCPNLKYFVVFSSLSCGRGNIGQSNYGMANSIMERICEKRKRDGFPGLAVQWGAIGDVGLVAKMQKENKELVIGGTLQQKIRNCLEVLDKLLKQDHPVVASMVVAEKRKNYGILNAVETVAHILGIKDMKSVSQHSTMAELGMDSITGTEVIKILEKDFDIFISTKDIRNLTFARLAEIEIEKNAGNTASKEEQGSNVILQHLPDNNSTVSVINMPSKGTIDSKKSSVFVLPGMEGILQPLELVSKNLEAQVFGVQYSYHDPEKTVAETAQGILPLILPKISKDEPFHIVGYSFGTVVTLEIAALLEEMGYNGKIVLIDGSPVYLISSLQQFLEANSEEELQINLLSKILSLLIPLDFITENKDRLMKCDNFESRADVVMSLIPPNTPNKEKFEKQAAIAIYTRLKAVYNYKFVHRKLKSAVNLFKSKHPIVDHCGYDYQLSELCENPVEVSVFNGNHLAVLQQPELAQALNKIIKND